MILSLSPTQSDINSTLRSFLLGLSLSCTAPQVKPIEIVLGQPNRVAEPAGSDYLVFTPILRKRLSTNVDGYVDAVFAGSITGTTLVIDSVTAGVLNVGATVFGVGVAVDTLVSSQVSGSPGGVGTYTVNNSQTVAPETLAAGSINFLQPTQVSVQIDVHGPNSADNAQTIATLFRDNYGVESFASSGFDVVPFYADDPKQIPFINAEEQLEVRWMIQAEMQANQVIAGVPQQFATSASIDVVSVDVTFPA